MPKILNFVLAALMSFIVCTSCAFAGNVGEPITNTVSVEGDQLYPNQVAQVNFGDHFLITVGPDNDADLYWTTIYIDRQLFKIESNINNNGVREVKLVAQKAGTATIFYKIVEKSRKDRCTEGSFRITVKNCQQPKKDEWKGSERGNNYQESRWSRESSRHYKNQDRRVNYCGDRYSYNNHRR